MSGTLGGNLAGMRDYRAKDQAGAESGHRTHMRRLPASGARSGGAPEPSLLALQRLAGNAAVARLVSAPAAENGQLPTVGVQRDDDELDGGAGPIDASLPGGVSTPAPPTTAAPAPSSRPLPFITMKRKHIDLTGADKYGHWWTEMDGAESYGWWPKRPVGFKETLLGTVGELNGITSFGGSTRKDPHHGDTAEDEFKPALTNSKSDAMVRSELRAFATGYSGEWRWTFGWGQNCHTFQESLMSTIGLVEP